MDSKTKSKINQIWINYGMPNIGKMMQILRSNNYSFTIKLVKEFLESQKTYQLHKGIRPKPTGHILAFAENERWQLDLIDYQKYANVNKGYKWVLLCIDIFTRKAYAEALKTKQTSDVLQGFKKILNTVGSKPMMIMTDNGREFTGNIMQDYLEKQRIIHQTAQIHDHHALGIIDRLCKTFKSMIARIFTEYDEMKWQP